jgi:iron complex transport system permease protein
MHTRLNRKWVFIALLALLPVTGLAAICIGETEIGAETVLSILLQPIVHQQPSWSPVDETIVLLIRVPRVLLAALVGAGLAVSGAALQSLFRNPMADPFILGISNGAALGASAVLLSGVSFGLGLFNLPLAAFACGTVTMLLVYELARMGNRVSTHTLLLSGIAVSAFLSACTSFLLFTSSENLHQVIFWMLGGFAGRTWDHVYMVLPFIVLGVIVMVTFARSLNALMFGEESALYLGVPAEQLKKVLLIVASVVTGAAVAVSGIIGFVGLIIPHIVRLAVGPDHRLLLPLAVVAGSIFLIAADTVARMVIAPAEIPIGVITALCGAPFFVFLLRRRKCDT